MILLHVPTDGGRKESGLAERRDCTVRSLAICAALPYTTAHGILSELGRKPGKGFRFAKVARRMGYTEHVQPLRGRMRVVTALRRYSRGRFVFRIRGHVFPVIDGVIHDLARYTTLERCIVTNVWEVPL